MAVALEAAGVGVFYLVGPLDEWTGTDRPPVGAVVVTEGELICLKKSRLGRDFATAILLVKQTFPGTRLVSVAVPGRRGRRKWFDV